MATWDQLEVSGQIRNDAIAGNRAAFSGNMDDIWHKKGTVWGASEIKSGAELAALAGADFKVYTVPMFLQSLDGKSYAQPEYGVSIVRDPWPEYVGNGQRGGDQTKVVEDANFPVQLGMIRAGARKRYAIRQNIETAEFFDEIVASGALRYTSAAVIERGIGFFVCAEITERVVRRNPDGTDDVVKGYATLYNRHDGASSSKANINANRVVCRNTLWSALSTGFTTRINHNGKAAIKFEAAKAELAKGDERFAAVIDTFKKMNATRATKDRIDRLFEATFPVEKHDEKELSQRRLNQIAQITKLSIEGIGTGGGTIYDWFNGMTQWLDHSEKGTGRITEETFVSSLYGNRAVTRERAFEAAAKMAYAA